MKYLKSSSFLFGLLFCCCAIKAQDTLADAAVKFVPEIATPIQPLSDFLMLLEDKSGKVKIDDFLKNGGSDTGFRPATTILKPDPFSVWWGKIIIEPSFSSTDFVIGVPFISSSGIDNGNDLAEVWITRHDRVLEHYHTGTLTPVSQRPLPKPINENIFPVTLHKGEVVTIYLRIQRLKYFAYPQFNFALQHRSVVMAGGGKQTSTGLVYLGIMSILFVFGLVFCAITKQRTFIWFTIMAACLGVHILLLHPANYLTQWFFSERPVMQFHAFFWLTGTFNIAVFLFISAFAQTKKLLPGWNKLVYCMIVLVGISILLNSIFLEVNPKMEVPVFIVLIVFLSSLVIGIRLIAVKHLYARWMGAALLWLFAFQVFGIMWNMQLLPEWFFNPWVIAQVGMMIIIFFALGYRFKQSAREKLESDHIKTMDEIKSRFFANISHEFRTPLTLIQGPLQQIEEAIPDVQKRTGTVSVPWRQIKTMRRHTDRLLELVNQLLDLSKLDSGKMKLQVIKGDVLQMLKVLTASFESMAERKAIHYQVHFPEETVIAFFDKDKLDKVVCNLLGNAFKYTPEHGMVSVIIETEDNRLRISVDDNGPGIPKKELDKVFDRFYQIEGSEDKGSGIGLALVKELVDLYRGQISVSSEPGKGVRFKVSLPIDKNSFKEDELVYGEWKESRELFMNQSVNVEEEVVRKTVLLQLPLLLVVEDNADLRSFICETVEHQYQVIEAANGKEGLEKAIADVPDVIVSDVMMPLMDGFTMTGKLKRDERTSHIPVILLTAKADQQHKIQGLETGADDYLLKPFDAKELLARIHNLVNQRKLLRKKFAGEIILKPSEVSVNSTDEIFLKKVMTAIEKNMVKEEFGVEELAREVTMSRSQLHRKLVALTNQSASEVLRNTRLLRAKELLQKKAATPSEVAYQVGFNSHTYFSKCFKEEFGVSPSEIGEVL